MKEPYGERAKRAYKRACSRTERRLHDKALRGEDNRRSSDLCWDAYKLEQRLYHLLGRT
jgi:hypothetical protein